MLYTCICHSRLFFLLTSQIIAESLNSPKFENLLLDDDLWGIFQGGSACWNQTVIVTIVYVIMSII